MPGFKFSVPNPLGQEEAAVRIKNYLERLQAKFQDQVSNLQQSWEGNKLSTSFKAMGFAVSGSMDVQPTEVLIEGQIPFAALLFKGKIESGIRDELTRVLGKPSV